MGQMNEGIQYYGKTPPVLTAQKELQVMCSSICQKNTLLMAHFHYSTEFALSVPCRAVPVFGCASTRPSYSPARPGATFSPLFWPDKIVVLSGPTNRAESG